jgi:serine/threonine protein kinase HipA of HipAB toxin-antitoxin module
MISLETLNNSLNRLYDQQLYLHQHINKAEAELISIEVEIKRLEALMEQIKELYVKNEKKS